ncbi:hypothetical protein Anas_02248 [Armadillidium nasatum]|uniref:Uncharacterized protein n=1 Tax=Armadillidium nasatum TaxID=96803 RepID=A0A5N5TGR6_9CRUS|nr:hypothetical protein Anas_02248 [Armadillidium nasatum]
MINDEKESPSFNFELHISFLYISSPPPLNELQRNNAIFHYRKKNDFSIFQKRKRYMALKWIKDELGNFVPHMVQLLGEWSETFPYDFRDERMMVGVRTLTHRCIALHPSLRRDVTQKLLDSIL